MDNNVVDLTQSKEIAEHVSRILIGAGSMPNFPAGIVSGWLPIGKATQGDKLVTDMKQLDRNKKTNYYISPRLLWELTGYVWEGKGDGDD